MYEKRAYDTHTIYHHPEDLYVTSEEQRLQTVTRVDQDFDIRRVQLPAGRFLPVDRPPRLPRRRPAIGSVAGSSATAPPLIDIGQLSPASSVDSSDSEPDADGKRPTDTDKSRQVYLYEHTLFIYEGCSFFNLDY